MKPIFVISLILSTLSCKNIAVSGASSGGHMAALIVTSAG